MLVRGLPLFLLDSITNERRYDQQQLGYEGHVVTCRDVALISTSKHSEQLACTVWGRPAGRTASLSHLTATARRIFATAKIGRRF